MNDYTYVLNDPILYYDPFGLVNWYNFFSRLGINSARNKLGGDMAKKIYGTKGKTSAEVYNTKDWSVFDPKAQKHFRNGMLGLTALMAGVGQAMADELTNPLNYAGPVGWGLDLSSQPAGGKNHEDELYWYDDDGHCIENIPGACKGRNKPDENGCIKGGVEINVHR